MSSHAIEPINIRNIYGGASGSSAFGGSGGAAAMDGAAQTANGMKSAGQAGGSLMDIISTAWNAGRFAVDSAKWLYKQPGRLASWGKNMAKRLGGLGKAEEAVVDASKAAKGIEETVEGASKIRNPYSAAPDVAKAAKGIEGATEGAAKIAKAGSMVSEAGKVGTAVEAVTASAKIGGGLRLMGGIIGKVNIPLMVTTASLDVAIHDKNIAPDSNAAQLAEKMDGAANDLGKRGPLGKAASYAVGGASVMMVSALSAGQEVFAAGKEAVRVVMDPNASKLEKAGAFLNAAIPVIPAVEGAEMGIKNRIAAGIEKVGAAAAEGIVRDGKEDAKHLMAHKLAQSTPDQRAAWIKREESAIGRSHLDAKAKESQLGRIHETAELASKEEASTGLPFNLPKAGTIPSMPTTVAAGAGKPATRRIGEQ